MLFGRLDAFGQEYPHSDLSQASARATQSRFPLPIPPETLGTVALFGLIWAVHRKPMAAVCTYSEPPRSGRSVAVFLARAHLPALGHSAILFALALLIPFSCGASTF